MDNYGVITKSFVSNLLICPLLALEQKRGLRTESGPAGLIGSATHKWAAAVESGQITLDEFVSRADELLSDFEPAEREDITSLVRVASIGDPIPREHKNNLQVEQKFAISDKGKLVDYWDKAALWRGIKDISFVMPDGIVHTKDYKTERQPKDLAEERYSYVLSDIAGNPKATKFQFARHYLRTQQYMVWHYEVKRGKSWAITETHPDGIVTTHGPMGQNPFLFYCKGTQNNINKMEPIPIPGPHCDSWFGGPPCPLKGTTCPLAADVPAVVDAVVTDPDIETPSALLRNLADPSKEVAINASVASWAYTSCNQLEGFIKAVKKRIEGWSKEKGPNGVFDIGGMPHGWFTSTVNEVDALFALTELLRSEMPLEDVVKALSISKTSLSKISKRKHGELREMLLKMAVKEVESKPKFGALKNLSEDY
ncbi:MAG: hypothetical protein WC551_13405 [Patescibacteria group bacterium]